jgi:heptosyltransferase-3
MVEKILLIRLRELGDTLLMTPLLRQLRRLHPNAQVDVLCQQANRCVLELNPNVSNTVILPPRAPARQFLGVAADLRRNRYDLVVDVQGLPKTAIMARLAGGRKRIGMIRPGWRNRLCYTHPYRVRHAEYAARLHLRLLQDDRVDLDDVDLDFPVGIEAEAAADAFWRKYLRPPVVAIFGICRFGCRAWASEKTAAVADRLAALGMQPWLVYGPGQADLARKITIQMRRSSLHEYEMPSFSVLRALLARCDLFFGNDGGPKHLAVAAGIPTVTVYRAESAVAWAPANTQLHRVVCTRACSGVTQLAGTFTDTDAITDIPVSAVWGEITSALRQTQSAAAGTAGRIVRRAA